jgi:hypothetical protein
VIGVQQPRQLGDLVDQLPIWVPCLLKDLSEPRQWAGEGLLLLLWL